MKTLIILALLTGGSIDSLATSKDTTEVGVYITSIYDLNYSESSYTIEFWLWRLNKNREFKEYYMFYPTEVKAKELLFSSTEWPDQTENQVISNRDTLYWDYENFRAVIKHDFDITDYPFDDEVLSIAFEGSAYYDDWVKLALDKKNSGSEPLIINGWEVGEFSIEKTKNKYKSNFGSPGDTTHHEYSGFRVSIPIKRKGGALFVKLFSGLLVAFVIALFSLRINITEADGRFGVCVGALFAALANMYIVNDNLPMVSKFTFMDKAHILTIFLILFLFITSTVSLKYYKEENLPKSKKIDKMATFVAVAVFLLGTLLIWPY